MLIIPVWDYVIISFNISLYFLYSLYLLACFARTLPGC